MRMIWMFAVSAVLVSGPAFAAQSGPAATSQPEKPKKDPGQKVVCKTEEFVGSMIPRRICKTRAEWEAGEFDAKQALDRQRTGDPRVQPLPGGR